MTQEEKTEPTRPEENESRFTYVAYHPVGFIHPDDIVGTFYVTPEHRGVLWEFMDDKLGERACYLARPVEEILATRTPKGMIPAETIGKTLWFLKQADVNQMLLDYYGTKGLRKLKKALNLG